MRKHLLPGLVVVCSVQFLTGCVSYSAYRNLQTELDKAKDSNRQLVDQYNQALLQLKAAREGRGGGDPAALQAAQARVAALERQLEEERRRGARIPKTEIDKIPGAEEEEGGIRLGESLLFNPGVADLKSSQLPVLDQVADLLQRDYRGETIIVEGHTDNVPLNKTKKLYEWNLQLGFERAKSVFRYLHEKHGIPEKQFRIETYGFSMPLDPSSQDTDEGRRRNRRVVIRLGGKQL
jgi:flagellar motor protein MotB